MTRSYVTAVLLFLTFSAQAQQNTGKYPSLLWEITGNGLKKPSYLFGTMHVSSKLVFHLPDSFYNAIQRVDAVALELNPEKWQGEMVRLDKLEMNNRKYSLIPSSDYLNDQSFRILSFEDELKTALSSEPAVVNNLLYRSYRSKEDFEEDTFLDLYIYQTGKKLGKRATGVEDYYETERIVLEAYADMAKDKKRKTIDTDGESMYSIEQKTQDAYRRGDLDLLDSLDNMMEQSVAFRNKFLYKRNEIQANSIDTILKRSSLFVGVGAAHLAGPKGVIELLRAKGYTLRPVLMPDINADRRDQLDKLKVPVQFQTNISEDDFFKVDMPGPLFNVVTDQSGLDRRQYADMSNGSYYMVTRVRTYSAFTGYREDKVLKKVDSLLYENIPGKILSKTSITRNGYKGIDILNKTRRGDLQHYQIYVTPFEILIFKMSGKESYVKGVEADKFFSSIKFRDPETGWKDYQPEEGGFTVKFPGKPDEYLNTSGLDGINRWEYQSVDNSTGNAFLVMKKSLQNFRFLEEDTFDLSMVDESFKQSEFIKEQLKRKQGTFNGIPCIDFNDKLNDGSFVNGKIFLRGADLFLVASRSTKNDPDPNGFISSFRFTDFKYPAAKEFTDTFLHFTVKTPVLPELEEKIRAQIEKMAEENFSSNNSMSGSYWPKPKYALFEDDSTGEMISVSMQQYPKYHYVKDSVSFWQNELQDIISRGDLKLLFKDSLVSGNTSVYKVLLGDTGTTRAIRRLWILQNDRIYRLVTLVDTSFESSFIKNFYSSFRPEGIASDHSIFRSNIDEFLKDFSSKDSVIHAKAEGAISNMYYGKDDVPKMVEAINKLKYGEKGYFDNKSRFIAELGYIRDSGSAKLIATSLKNIYDRTADTSIFQNKVLQALARQRTKESYSVLKDIILKEPPAFESEYDYTSFFNELGDSLKLAKTLFPDILQLSGIEEYKDNITNILVQLVDSNLISGKEYESYFTKFYFNAKMELKKLRGRDERMMEQELNDEHEGYDNSDPGDLNDYAILLMPFYDSKPGVPDFFNKLLQTKDKGLLMSTAVLMLKNNRPVNDSILLRLASMDYYHNKLYRKMKSAGIVNRFPNKYNNQLSFARSMLVESSSNDYDSIQYVDKKEVSFKNKRGYVYFFKYRVKKDDDWKMAISGIQPLDTNRIEADVTFAKFSDKKIKEDEPVRSQFDAQLKRLLFISRKSGKKFYEYSGMNRFRKDN